MKYLIESKVFNQERDIDYIIHRFRHSGYFSTKLSGDLDKLLGVKDAYSIIMPRAEKISEFFEKFRIDYIDDKLLGVIDDDYEYSTMQLLYIDNSRISDTTVIRPDDNSDLISNVFVFIVRWLVELKKARESKKKDKFSIYYYSEPKLSKIISDINPLISITIFHNKLHGDYIYGWVPEGGIMYRNRTSISDRISSRLGYGQPWDIKSTYNRGSNIFGNDGDYNTGVISSTIVDLKWIV